MLKKEDHYNPMWVRFDKEFWETGRQSKHNTLLLSIFCAIIQPDCYKESWSYSHVDIFTAESSAVQLQISNSWPVKQLQQGNRGLDCLAPGCFYCSWGGWWKSFCTKKTSVANQETQTNFSQYMRQDVADRITCVIWSSLNPFQITRIRHFHITRLCLKRWHWPTEILILQKTCFAAHASFEILWSVDMTEKTFCLR